MTKISEYINTVGTLQGTDLMDVSVDQGGGNFQTQKLAYSNLITNVRLVTDTLLGGQTLSATAQSPGAGQDGFAIVWNNGAGEYQLSAVAGGGNTIYTANDSIGASTNRIVTIPVTSDLDFGGNLIITGANIPALGQGGNVGVKMGGGKPLSPLHIGSGFNAGGFGTPASPLTGHTAIFQNNNAPTDPSRVAIVAGASDFSGIDFGDVDDIDIGRIFYDHSENSMSFYTNTALAMKIQSDQTVLMNSLAGGGSRMVVVDNNGLISAQALTTGTGIYGGSGTVPTTTAVGITDTLNFLSNTLVINAANNGVGIGRVGGSPGVVLDVDNGDVRMRGTSVVNLVYLDYSANTVGLGTTPTAGYRLDVLGLSRFINGSSTVEIGGNPSLTINGGSNWNGTNFFVRNSVAGEYFTASSATSGVGRIGINTSAPDISSALHVVGMPLFVTTTVSQHYNTTHRATAHGTDVLIENGQSTRYSRTTYKETNGNAEGYVIMWGNLHARSWLRQNLGIHAQNDLVNIIDNATTNKFRWLEGTATEVPLMELEKTNGLNLILGSYQIAGTKVVGARQTGWTDQTATGSKADLGASPTVGALASFCRSLYDDLKTHGLIGN